jgi:hypothetical protein
VAGFSGPLKNHLIWAAKRRGNNNGFHILLLAHLDYELVHLSDRAVRLCMIPLFFIGTLESKYVINVGSIIVNRGTVLGI